MSRVSTLEVREFVKLPSREEKLLLSELFLPHIRVLPDISPKRCEAWQKVSAVYMYKVHQILLTIYMEFGCTMLCAHFREYNKCGP